MNYNKNNIFAKIIVKKLSANIIYEDDILISFHDINPVAPIHILVVPKGEYINYSDFIKKAEKLEIIHFFSKIDELAKMFELDKSGYRLITNNGSEVGQTIFHFHFHIIGGIKITKLI
jgi:diadenosine tetraphosphate (Ap4A) HIT family hydrolase